MFNTVINNVKETVLIVSIISSIFLGIWGQKQKAEADRYRDNLYSKTVQWTDENGRLITEVSELRFTLSELKSVNIKDSANYSAAQKELLLAKKNIEEMGIKLNNAESYFKSELAVKTDSIITSIVKDGTGATIALNPIKTANLELSFTVIGDSVLVDHLYKTNIVTIVNRKKDKLTSNGRKRLFIARWVNPRYDYWATTRADDPNAKLNNTIYIEFQSKRGKRK